MNNYKEVKVSELPNCNIPGCKNIAKYDCKLSIGPWGYVCQKHFEAYNCELGLGKGQELII